MKLSRQRTAILVVTAAIVVVAGWFASRWSDQRFVGNWTVITGLGGDADIEATLNSFGSGQILHRDNHVTRQVRFRWRVDGSKWVVKESDEFDRLIAGMKSLLTNLSGSGSGTKAWGQLFGENEEYELLVVEPNLIRIRGPMAALPDNRQTIEFRRVARSR